MNHKANHSSTLISWYGKKKKSQLSVELFSVWLTSLGFHSCNSSCSHSTVPRAFFPSRVHSHLSARFPALWFLWADLALHASKLNVPCHSCFKWNIVPSETWGLTTKQSPCLSASAHYFYEFSSWYWSLSSLFDLFDFLDMMWAPAEKGLSAYLITLVV